jgi:hypothetical protein
MIEQLFWTRDDDGEVVHRLGGEWDGNHGAWREWGHYQDPMNNWAIYLGTTWSHWGIGIDYEYTHEPHWVNQAIRRVTFRRASLTLTFGPWYLSWERCKPIKVPTL